MSALGVDRMLDSISWYIICEHSVNCHCHPLIWGNEIYGPSSWSCLQLVQYKTNVHVRTANCAPWFLWTSFETISFYVPDSAYMSKQIWRLKSTVVTRSPSLNDRVQRSVICDFAAVSGLWLQMNKCFLGSLTCVCKLLRVTLQVDGLHLKRWQMRHWCRDPETSMRSIRVFTHKKGINTSLYKFIFPLPFSQLSKCQHFTFAGLAHLFNLHITPRSNGDGLLWMHVWCMNTKGNRQTSAGQHASPSLSQTISPGECSWISTLAVTTC